jgi:hypothetical protein
MTTTSRTVAQTTLTLTLLTGVSMLAGCSTLKVESAFGREWDVERGLGKSYAWFPATAGRPDTSKATNPSVDQLIRRLVDSELAAKGYVSAAGSPADWWMDYHVARETRDEWLAFGPVVQYYEGALYLDAFGRATRRFSGERMRRPSLRPT